MRRTYRFRFLQMASTVFLFLCAASMAHAKIERSLTVKVLAEGLNEPHGVAVHPETGDIYVAERGNGQIRVFKNGQMSPALASGWVVTNELPRWAITPEVPKEKWMSATLVKPGPITISSNGLLYVAEQIPNGRILEFTPNEQGKFAVAKGIPVPWLDQEFQWRDIFADEGGRFFIAGADEVGSDFMKFGSSLVREPDGDWWVVDFGPFANFDTFVISDRQDVMILGDRNKGTLSWWEVDRHIMLGGSPDATGRADLLSLALYPDGSFILAEQTAPGKATLKRMDPFTGQQTVLSDQFESVGDIAVDRKNVRYLVTDPAAGRLLECIPTPPIKRFNEVAMRQIVRSVEGMMGLPTEAPAFLNTFFDRLQSATEDLTEDDATHAVNFNLSDIAGKMPIVAGRIRATVEVAGAEDDPIEQVEFFLLFPSKVVMTETAVTPSLSFFSARRKSGKVEQTKTVFKGDVGVYRLSGTNISKIASAPGGLHVPIVACGMDQSDGGVHINLSFLGVGIYGDYYLTLFQGPREQSAKLVVKSTNSPSGNITYEASFMDETTIQGMDSTEVREKVSNLLISGFGSNAGANRSVGWLRLGQFPASMTVAFGGDAGAGILTGAQKDLKEIVEKKRVEMSLDAATDVEIFSSEEITEDAAPADRAPEEGGTPDVPAPSAVDSTEAAPAAPESPEEPAP